MSDVEKARKAMTGKKVEKTLQDSDFVSTGLTLVNLGLYGRTHGGLAKGHVYRLIGRSESGKTFVGRGILAEAAVSPFFADYDLVYDDIEAGALMDTLKFFGQGLVNRLSAPAHTKERKPIHSRTITSFYRHINARLSKGKPCIYITDSLDALSAENETINKQTGKVEIEDLANKMTDGKAKIHSDQLRRIITPIRETGSILIIVQHAKVNMGSSWGGDVTTGGDSPLFYSTADIWLSKKGPINKKIKLYDTDTEHKIGVKLMAKIKKNRISGGPIEAEFPLYYDYGIDDMSSCIDYLVENGKWTREKGKLVADDFDFEGHTTLLLRKIENENLQRELQILTGNVFREIQNALITKRKPRY